MTATALPSRPAGTTIGPASISIATRTLRKFVRTPQLIVVSTIQGAMFLLIFRYVFGGAITSDGVPYVDFLVPGFVTTSVLFVGTATAAGVAEDLEQGFLDRLRSLPIPRAAVLAGRVLADSGVLAWNLVVTVAVGFAIGFRLHGSLLEGIGALALCFAFGFAFTWLFVAIGLVAGNAQAAQGMSMMVFPLTFVSSAYVPAESMPGVLQAFAEQQPITYMVDSVRQLALGQPADALPGALLWSAAILATAVPFAVARYRRG